MIKIRDKDGRHVGTAEEIDDSPAYFFGKALRAVFLMAPFGWLMVVATILYAAGILFPEEHPEMRQWGQWGLIGLSILGLFRTPAALLGLAVLGLTTWWPDPAIWYAGGLFVLMAIGENIGYNFKSEEGEPAPVNTLGPKNKELAAEKDPTLKVLAALLDTDVTNWVTSEQVDQVQIGVDFQTTNHTEKTIKMFQSTIRISDLSGQRLVEFDWTCTTQIEPKMACSLRAEATLEKNKDTVLLKHLTNVLILNTIHSIVYTDNTIERR